jgi:hypothetical protein
MSQEYVLPLFLHYWGVGPTERVTIHISFRAVPVQSHSV